jgi:hypothetical protein
MKKLLLTIVAVAKADENEEISFVDSDANRFNSLIQVESETISAPAQP